MENEAAYVDDPISTDTTNYAGFWLRLAAYIIDAIIVSIVLYGLLALLGVLGFASGGFDNIDPENPDMGMAMLFAGIGMGFALFAVVAVWLYYAILESGHNQATIGKMAVGIKVTDMYGERISFGRATGRYFGKIISGMIVYIGFIMAGFTERRQALHDIMANCLVLKK